MCTPASRLARLHKRLFTRAPDRRCGLGSPRERRTRFTSSRAMRKLRCTSRRGVRAIARSFPFTVSNRNPLKGTSRAARQLERAA